MAVNLTRVCDHPVRQKPCGEEAVVTTEVKMGDKNFRGDHCKKHAEIVQVQLQKMGIVPTATEVLYKKRGAYVTKSGKVFSMRDARAWLRENSPESVAANGRLSQAQLDMYASVH